MEYKVDISKVLLFQCKTIEKDRIRLNVADVIGNKVFDLSQNPKKYEVLKSTLELNIRRKLASRETSDLSKSEVKISPIEAGISITKKRGRKLTALTLKIEKENPLEDLLNAKTDQEFRSNGAKYAEEYIQRRGEIFEILGLVQFDISTGKKYEKFLAILITDFNKTILSVDPIEAMKFLENAFDQNFKIIIFYPYFIGEIGGTIEFSKKKVKAYQRVSIPEIFINSNIAIPFDPQRLLEEVYKKMRGQTNNLKEIAREIGEENLDKVFICIRIKESKFYLSLRDFIDKARLIFEEEGQGIFVYDEEFHAEIAGKNLLEDGKIRKSSLEDLHKEVKNKKNK
jgi:hypothetical protein